MSALFNNSQSNIPINNGRQIYAQGWVFPTLISQSSRDTYHLRYFLKTTNVGSRASGIYQYDKNSRSWTAQFNTATASASIVIKNESVALEGNATALNFTGNGVSVAGVGAEKAIHITSSTGQAILQFGNDGYVEKMSGITRFIVNPQGLTNIGGLWANRLTLNYT